MDGVEETDARGRVVVEEVVCTICKPGPSRGRALVVCDGDGGLRVTDSACSTWRTLRIVPPSDPEYDRAIRLLEKMTEPDHPHRDHASRLLARLDEQTREDGKT